jgi:hypothetical protein
VAGSGPLLAEVLQRRYPASSSICLPALLVAWHWVHAPPVRIVPCVPQVMALEEQRNEKYRGEFNRSSQHLDLEVCKWDDDQAGLWQRQGGRRCGRRAARR